MDNNDNPVMVVQAWQEAANAQDEVPDRDHTLGHDSH
jgi:hypothetical protein